VARRLAYVSSRDGVSRWRGDINRTRSRGPLAGPRGLNPYHARPSSAGSAFVAGAWIIIGFLPLVSRGRDPFAALAHNQHGHSAEGCPRALSQACLHRRTRPPVPYSAALRLP